MRVDGVPLDLPPREFQLLLELARESGAVVAEGALLLAFALVWLVWLVLMALMARQRYNATDRQAFDQNLPALGENLLAPIAPIETSGEARAMVAATVILINQSYPSNRVPGLLLMALRAADGKRLFWSPEGGNAVVRSTPGRIEPGELNGQPYRVYAGKGGRSMLLVAAPRMAAGRIVRPFSSGLTIATLIVRAFVLLPLAQALDQLLARLRHKLLREQTFVQDVAHQLRAPMAVISAAACTRRSRASIALAGTATSMPLQGRVSAWTSCAKQLRGSMAMSRWKMGLTGAGAALS